MAEEIEENLLENDLIESWFPWKIMSFFEIEHTNIKKILVKNIVKIYISYHHFNFIKKTWFCSQMIESMKRQLNII